VPEFTDRQATAFTEIVADIRARGVEVADRIEDPYWVVEWADEIRPGRGHSFNGIWSDGEHVVQVLMDVYGYPSVGIGAVEWLHNSSDDECSCDRCVADRAEDDEEAAACAS
jgi:hypothetical protein